MPRYDEPKDAADGIEATELDLVYEQRRAGRRKDVVPNLIPVLRGIFPYPRTDLSQTALSREGLIWIFAAGLMWVVGAVALAVFW